jgi:D-proline reductase (dithiol) PrdB
VRTLARAFTRHPGLGRLWGRWTRAGGAAPGVPWAPMTRPLRGCTATLVTTGGVHLREDRPFDMTDPHGDPTWRAIPAGVDVARLTITHDYYDHRDADRDVNVVFPLERFRELVAGGVLAGLTPTHWSFMGHIDGPLVRRLEADVLPAFLARLRVERPDFVFLTPS